MKALHQSFQYLKHLLTAGNAHGLHSPFIFELYTNVLREHSKYQTKNLMGEELIAGNKNPLPPNTIEALRKKLYDDDSTISVRDFGSAERGAAYKRSISSIAKASAKKPALAALLWRLVKRWKPTVVIDLGTSLGLTTLYLSDGATHGTVHTFEGCGNTLQVAQKNFKEMNATNIVAHEGDLNATLAQTVSSLDKIDLAFFDANHRYEPTMQYFNTCLPKVHNDTLFIFDDIHWSAEMTRAWNDICNHPSVTASVDLYHVGLVFFRKEQGREKFRLRI